MADALKSHPSPHVNLPSNFGHSRSNHASISWDPQKLCWAPWDGVCLTPVNKPLAYVLSHQIWLIHIKRYGHKKDPKLGDAAALPFGMGAYLTP